MKNLNFLAVCLFVILTMVVEGWSSCRSYTVQQVGGCSLNAPSGCPTIVNWDSSWECYQPNTGSIYKYCQYNNWNGGNYLAYSCDTEAERDSLKCVLKPSLDGCKTPPQQTCEESGKYWYNDTCNDNPQCTQADSTWQQCAYFFKEDSLGNVNRVAIENTYTRTSCVTNTLAEVADSCSNTPTINDSTSCDTLGGFWYDNACNDKPKTCNYIDSTCIYNGGEFTLKSFSGDSTCIYECVKGENTNPVQLMTFNASTTPSQTSYALKSNYSVGSVTSVVTKQDYDFVDSLMGVQCSNHLYRGIKNGKYIYWYNNQAIPDSVTHIVKVY